MTVEDRQVERASQVSTGIQVRVGIDRTGNSVVIEFGSQIKWVSLPASDAIKLSEIILEKVAILESEKRAGDVSTQDQE